MPMTAGEHFVHIERSGSNIASALRALHTLAGPTELYWRISRQAAAYARRALSPESLDCYVLAFLLQHARLYSAWKAVCPAAATAATAAAAAAAAAGFRVVRHEQPEPLVRPKTSNRSGCFDTRLEVTCLRKLRGGTCHGAHGCDETCGTNKCRPGA